MSFELNSFNDSNIINILCLGDSLTAGLVENDLHEPYTTYLTHLFKTQGLEHVVFVNAGVHQDTVEDIQSRLPALLEQHPFDFLILFGGINDLGDIDMVPESFTHDSPDDRVAHISFDAIYNQLMASPSLKSFLQLTIPYTAFDRLDPNEKNNKDALNRRILLHPCPKKRVLDINSPHLSFNHLLATECERALYWQDAIHYSVKGYQRLAECIYTGLYPILQEYVRF
ncbi:hypothetical protein BG011_005203 [Mortierella polycephala]|uniref:SGNH hydrolase-type esterase domain-containing protein n=1 Tax=Mortierella polycephala TaxID=41804 RepID=A0A9P6U0M2_9FUNG|nr:hypothetical protein BG011_005203 [Mortierella polycephala]